MAIKKKTTAQTLAKTKSKRDGYQVNLSDDEKSLIDEEARHAGLERSTLMRFASVKYSRELKAIRLGGAGGTT